MTDRRRTLAFFFAVTLLYFAFSPGVFRLMGYMEEEVGATRKVLQKLHLIDDPSLSTKVFPWPRNGLLPLTIHGLFIAPARWIFGDDVWWEDLLLALQPVLLTAGILTIVFVWASRLADSRGWGLLIALAGGFATMLWPYAYTGLETQQSFFLLFAAWAAMEKRDSPGWWWHFLFVAAAALAVSVKSTGAFLLPAVLYLVLLWGRGSSRAVRTAVALSVIGPVFIFSAWTRTFFWDAVGGTRDYLEYWMVSDGLTYALNNVAFLVSPNKGLLVFSPLLLLALLSLPTLLVGRKPVAIFALLVLAGLMGGYSLLTCWADENWGPRYLHSAVAPLLLCISAVRRGVALRLRTVAGVALLTAAGFFVSALGAMYWYGSLQHVAGLTGQNTLEWIHGDPVWNHIKFNARLFLVWLKPSDAGDVYWAPKHQWYFEAPKEAPKWTPIDLAITRDPVARRIAIPQSFIAQRLGKSCTVPEKIVMGLMAGGFFVGLVMLVLLGRARSSQGKAAPERSG